ncbi:relaxase domain-containing protein [Streptomyces sp. LE64]|uniref:relaxase domain-containing protein n=1 Tax=Streptomyces sp. LE64 TaxID=3448653 RepID=UPI0040413CE9
MRGTRPGHRAPGGNAGAAAGHGDSRPGVPSALIAWKSTRRERIKDALETITDQYVKEHGRLPDERARNGLGWWAAQDTRPDKKTPRPLPQLLAWWRTSAILNFGQQMIDGLLERCRAAAAVIRAGVRPLVDTALAAVDVAAVVYTVRNAFARRHVLAEARRHLLETLRGRAFPPGVDDYIADQALARHSRQLTVPQEGRRTPAPDQITYTADFPWPARWFIAATNGKPPRSATRYERAQVASLALQNAIRTARTTPPARNGAPAATTPPPHTGNRHDDRPAADPPHAVDHPGRDTRLTPAQRAAAIHTHLQAAMPQEYAEGRTTDPATWTTAPERLAALAKLTAATEARKRSLAEADTGRRARAEGELPGPAADPETGPRRQEHEQQRHQPGPGQDQGRGVRP